MFWKILKFMMKKCWCPQTIYINIPCFFYFQEYDALVVQQQDIENKLHELESSPPRSVTIFLCKGEAIL